MKYNTNVNSQYRLFLIKDTQMSKYSFKRGYNQIPQGKVKEVRERIVKSLGLTIASFYPRLRGEIIPKITEYKIIESIFSEYDITDIWGEK